MVCRAAPESRWAFCRHGERFVGNGIHREDLMAQEAWLIEAEQGPTSRGLSILGGQWTW